MSCERSALDRIEPQGTTLLPRERAPGDGLWPVLGAGWRKHSSAKPLHGFGGAGVLELVDDFNGDTYRAIYTVRLQSAVYVLHAFQKKSKQGSETPQREIELIRSRLRDAELLEQQRQGPKE